MLSYDRRLDIFDFKLPYCAKCGHDALYLLVKFKPTASYVAKYFCSTCDAFVEVVWRRPK